MKTVDFSGTIAASDLKVGRYSLVGADVENVKTVDFSETIEACDLKVGRYRQLIDFKKVCEY